MSELPNDLGVALAGVVQHAGAFATRVLFRPIVASTNDEAAALAAGGAPEGTIVIAEEQTAGRGRRGRTWHSPAGAGVYFSIVFRPTGAESLTTQGGGSATALLTVMSGVAVAEGIRQASGLAVAIKWPNDVVVEARVPVTGRARRRKLAGILAEAAVTGEQLQHVIVGIGVNVREAPRPREIVQLATSIEGELGRSCERGALVAAIVAALAFWRRRTLAGDLQAVLQRWRELSPSSRGVRVGWEAQGRLRRGVTAGIDSTGALLVDTPEGRERVVAGELSWEW
ncbi:MAG: biotin--[acetyl-CoA-carboxylase] ligase [Luteitalea sp.]|nr:biotin--[acetyl-CoA-carboxylase] ligase [Luteitalea sp.]